MSEKVPSNASTANSPSPSINSVAQNSWKGGTEHGTTNPSEVLGPNKYQQQPVKLPVK